MASSSTIPHLSDTADPRLRKLKGKATDSSRMVPEGDIPNLADPTDLQLCNLKGNGMATAQTQPPQNRDNGEYIQVLERRILTPRGAEELPKALKLVLDATSGQAAAFSTVMGLCAATLGALSSRLGSLFDDDSAPDSWKVLRVFLYTALMLNLNGAFLSLMIIKQCSDLQLTMWEKGPVSGRTHDLRRVTHLLRRSGMYRHYVGVNRVVACMAPLAWVFTFVTLSLWVCLSQDHGWVTMILFAPIGIISVIVFCITSFAQEWT